jgi:hypothetical protein
MTENFKNNFNLSKPRRKYYSEDCGLDSCPECGFQLIEDNCTILIAAKSDTDEGEFISNLSGSHFCKSCPVVVFDSDKVDKAAKLGIRGAKNLRYLIAGIVDLNAIPIEKRQLELGAENNPLPLVHFLPDFYNKTVVNANKINRNDPCLCGSGKKFKKCCGKLS